MTEKIKDRLTKLLEAHQLAVKNAPQDQGREREDLEEQIRKHVTGQEATPEPTPGPLWSRRPAKHRTRRQPGRYSKRPLKLR